MTKKISQREAQRLKMRVRYLEEKIRSWASSYPQATPVYTISPSDKCIAVLDAVRRMGHPVIARVSENNLEFLGGSL